MLQNITISQTLLFKRKNPEKSLYHVFHKNIKQQNYFQNW